MLISYFYFEDLGCNLKLKISFCFSFFETTNIYQYDNFRTEPGCTMFGDGALRTKFEIDLNKPEGSEGSCGVKFDKVGICFSRGYKLKTKLPLQFPYHD